MNLKISTNIVKIMTNSWLDKKFWTSFLWNFETNLKNYLVPFVPKFIETYHLTYMTIIWSIWILLFSYIASKNWLIWLNFVSIFIALQYITDLLDWEIWRKRNTWLIKWWYFMDHFLDYIFLSSIIIGYVFIMPKIIQEIWVFDLKLFVFPIEINYYYLMFYTFTIFTWFMIVSFLSFSVTNKFQIAYYGLWPTEIRILFIIFNSLLILFPKYTLNYFTPIMLLLGLIWIVFLVYKTQKTLWEIDMTEKNK